MGTVNVKPYSSNNTLLKMSKTIITRREAAEILGLSPQTLAKWALTGKNLPVIKLGNRTVRYLYADVMNFIESRRTSR
jgi:excisionase family DNA binding protein